MYYAQFCIHMTINSKKNGNITDDKSVANDVLCFINTVNLPDTVMLGGAHNGAEAFPLGQYGHVIYCSERQACSSSGGVGYSCAVCQDRSIMCSVTCN